MSRDFITLYGKSYNNFKVITHREKLNFFIINLILLYFFVFFSGVFVIIIDYYIQKHHAISIKSIISQQQYKSRLGLSLYEIFFYTCLLAPVIEELIHRLPLNLNKWNIAISMSLVILLYSGGLFHYNFSEISTWLKIILPLVIFVSFYNLKIKKITLNRKAYNIYIILMVLLFGIIHLNNFYREIPSGLIFFSLVFLIPNILLGFFASIVRLKIGIIYSILLHIIFNTIAFAVNYF